MEVCDKYQWKPLSPALNEFLKRVRGKLTGKQRQKVREMLLKHESLFASNDNKYQNLMCLPIYSNLCRNPFPSFFIKRLYYCKIIVLKCFDTQIHVQ